MQSTFIASAVPGLCSRESQQTSWRRALFSAVLLLPFGAAHAAVTAEDYARAEQFLPWNYSKLALNVRVEPHWLGKTERFWYRRDTPAGSEFTLVDPTRGTAGPAFDQAKLAAALSLAAGKDYSAGKLPFDDFEYVNHERALAFALGGAQWTCDLESYRCTQAAPRYAEDELPSPDGRWVAFLRDRNLFVRSTTSHEEIPLTTDGQADFDYGSHAGADLTFVTDQVARRKFPPLALWSHDSKYILTQRLDQRQVGMMYLLQSVPPGNSVRPVLWPYRYPFPGDRAVPTVQLVILDIATRSRVTINSDPLLVLYVTPLELNQVQWSDDDTKVYFVDLQRGAKSWTLRMADARTGATRAIIEERSSTHVGLIATADGEHLDAIRIISHGTEGILYSERDGWGHLYLYDVATGKIKNQITRGEWKVGALVWVDEKSRKLYFVAGGREPGRDPYFRHLYRINLDGSNIELLSPEDADHEIVVSPAGHYFVDNYSRVDLPSTSVLRSADGKVIRTLERANIDRLIAAGWRPPERFSAKAADGKTDLYGAIFRPSRFDASKIYPVIDCIYPGPQTIHTPKSFMDPSPALGEPESLAELGFIAVTVDGRGTPGRSKAFHDVSYGHMGQAGNLEDHTAVLRQLHKRYPYMDLDRVGITGHSAGGYASAHAILAYPDFYKVAVSSAGVHDLRGYNADWGEIYQGMPNGNNYVGYANKELAANLKGKLLLIYGDMDDNVSPALTLQLMDALIEAHKDFDVVVLPGGNHRTTYTDPYITRHRWDYFVRYLMGVEPPAGYVINPPLTPGHE